MYEIFTIGKKKNQFTLQFAHKTDLALQGSGPVPPYRYVP